MKHSDLGTLCIYPQKLGHTGYFQCFTTQNTIYRLGHWISS